MVVEEVVEVVVGLEVAFSIIGFVPEAAFGTAAGH